MCYILSARKTDLVNTVTRETTHSSDLIHVETRGPEALVQAELIGA